MVPMPSSSTPPIIPLKLLNLPFVPLQMILRKFTFQEVITFHGTSSTAARILKEAKLRPVNLLIYSGPEVTLICSDNGNFNGGIYIENEGTELLYSEEVSSFLQDVGCGVAKVRKFYEDLTPTSSYSFRDHKTATTALLSLFMPICNFSINLLTIEDFDSDSFTPFAQWSLLTLAKRVEINGDEMKADDLTALLRQFHASYTLEVERLVVTHFAWFSRELLLSVNVPYLDIDGSDLTGLDINAFVRKCLNEPGQRLKYMKTTVKNSHGLMDGLPGNRERIIQTLLMADGKTAVVFDLLQVNTDTRRKISIAIEFGNIIHVFVDV
ncbi:unnamed protein product [Caenorhabditis sp. 36 PRJEB53466]|nr:unnamed protein product [Caenorhabditis sp. 36 PRJEB53466]